MKPVLTPAEAAELDRASQARGIAAADLMEAAGRAVARACVDLVGGVYGRRAVVVCGKGNNGGDGAVAARHLARWGMRVAVVLLREPSGEPAAANAARLGETSARVLGADADGLRRELDRVDVAIDAIFGTGFRGMPEGDEAAAIAALNASAVPVVAVDIPSGVDGATGAVAGEAVRAELTVTFGAAKLGAVLLPGAEHAGAVRVVDIGFPEDLVEAHAFLTEPDDVAAALPRRSADTHKRASGVLLVVAGSRAMTGAPRLIAEAAGRLGAGLIQVAAPASALAAIQAETTEAVFLALPETDDGTLAPAAVEPVLEALERADALAIGPGLGASDEPAAAVRSIVAASPVPLVIDADALNAFAGRAAEMGARRSPAVLTPHLGEFGRLTGLKGTDVEADRPTHVRALAAEADAVTLLKGSRTVIAEPGGRLRVNPTGSAVLATAGSGDVLTGAIGALLARAVAPADAAAAGAYLHGLAGALAGRAAGEGTLAGDVVDALPRAVAAVRAAP